MNHRITDYLIDGYNLLHAQGSVAYRLDGDAGLERARRDLCRWVRLGMAGRRSVRTVEVVFDAHGEKTPQRRVNRRTLEGVAVWYAGGYATADELIADLCAEHSAPQQLAVVSDDREVARSARRVHATALSCGQFETLMKTQPDEDGPRPAESDRDYWKRMFAGSTVGGDRNDVSEYQFYSDMREGDAIAAELTPAPKKAKPAKPKPPPATLPPDVLDALDGLTRGRRRATDETDLSDDAGDLGDFLRDMRR